ncbi:hypothetical protein KIW84_063953 [Lathyrus oleraceus]|uniref:Uncharacterized protein n=1 Tax=Pisum sativum TaxID=3888 RepID=A0A9D4WB73_PEA|nr:hypothetical protein KIW84_063953 [Pisum sativum]
MDESTLDGESGAIVPFGSAIILPPPTLCSGVSSLPEELFGFTGEVHDFLRIYNNGWETASDAEKIVSVELVGSGSRIPDVSTLLTSLFKREPSRKLNASEGVARGCALQCAMLSPLYRVRDYEHVIRAMSLKGTIISLVGAKLQAVTQPGVEGLDIWNEGDLKVDEKCKLAWFGYRPPYSAFRQQQTCALVTSLVLVAAWFLQQPSVSATRFLQQGICFGFLHRLASPQSVVTLILSGYGMVWEFMSPTSLWTVE